MRRARETILALLLVVCDKFSSADKVDHYTIRFYPDTTDSASTSSVPPLFSDYTESRVHRERTRVRSCESHAIRDAGRLGRAIKDCGPIAPSAPRVQYPPAGRLPG